MRSELLAALAALLATNCGMWQFEATRIGGAPLAVCLALLVLLIRSSQTFSPLRASLYLGGLVGLLAIEDRQLAVAVLVALGLRHAAILHLPRLGALVVGALSACVAAIIGLLPAALGRVSEKLGLRLAGHESLNSAQLGLELDIPTAASSFLTFDAFRELGYYLLAFALLGASAGVIRPRWRVLVLPVLGVTLLHVCLPSAATGLFTIIAVALLASLGASQLIMLTNRAQLPLQKTWLRLAALFHVCALLIVAEDARERMHDRSVNATTLWSEQAFERLPPRSLVLTHTHRAAWRLWAERVATGVRPDVLLVPQSLLAHGALAHELLATEPALSALVRDTALHGEVGEFALSQLADARPLRVEPDPSWDRRLLAHCVPDGLWFRFAPHELGRSDRTRALRLASGSFNAVRRAAKTPFGRDELTLEQLRRDLSQQVALSLALKDVSNARQLLKRLRRLDPEPELIARFNAELETPSGVVSLRELLGE
jgi:hypothetical protein